MPNFAKVKPFLLTLCLFSIITGCGRETITGSGEAKQEKREVSTFSGINVDGKYAILGTIGKPADLVISSNPNILPHIVSSVEDDILTIKDDKSADLQPSVDQQIWFTTETFQTLNLSGNGQFQMAKLNGKTLDCSLKGSHRV